MRYISGGWYSSLDLRTIRPAPADAGRGAGGPLAHFEDPEEVAAEIRAAEPGTRLRSGYREIWQTFADDPKAREAAEREYWAETWPHFIESVWSDDPEIFERIVDVLRQFAPSGGEKLNSDDDLIISTRDWHAAFRAAGISGRMAIEFLARYGFLPVFDCKPVGLMQAFLAHEPAPPEMPGKSCFRVSAKVFEAEIYYPICNLFME